MIIRLFKFAVWGLLSLVLSAAVSSPAVAQVVLFAEDFDGLPLGPPVDEPIPFPNAFTHEPPPGWFRNASQVPGVGNPDLGIEEWEGWSFASSDFWQLAAQLDTGSSTLREAFFRGFGTVAVADPDQWNDLGNPANVPAGGFFNTLLETPAIDVSSATPPDIRLKLGFDSSWFGGACCNDGVGFDPPGQPEPFSDNQSAFVRIRNASGAVTEVLRWEAAPFIDVATGDPRPMPGPGTIPNPDFKPLNPNERVWVDLEPQSGAALSTLLGVTGTGSGGGGGATIEFGMEDAGDDGWWAIDNVEVLTLTTIQGDMNVNDMLDAGDVPAFALGLLDADEYRDTYYGEFPVTRGSPDGLFDFDDIEWFVNILDAGGISTSVEEVVALITPAVPEPGGLVLFGLGTLCLGWRRRCLAGVSSRR